MNIKTDELRRYLNAAAQIKPNPTAPNLDVIKIECTGQEIVFTKTNNNIWCRYSYVCQAQPAEVLLINEKVLNGIVLTSKEHEINISPNSDARTTNITSGEDVLRIQKQDASMFPNIPTTIGERVKISADVMERIRTAAKYVNTGANITALNFVNVGLCGIFASNYSIVYHHNTFPLPDLLLDQEPLNTIKSTDDVLYWSSDSYNFFQCEGFMYGFIKTAIKPLNFTTIVNQTGQDNFIIKRQDLVDFCTLVHYTKRQENPLATLAGADDKTLQLRYNDPDFDINVSRNVVMESNAPVTEFKFSVDSMALLLKTLPFELLIFTRSNPGGHLIVTASDDPDYKGIIARLQEDTKPIA